MNALFKLQVLPILKDIKTMFIVIKFLNVNSVIIQEKGEEITNNTYH